jgi:preprotein translocase subunit YajC
MLEALVIIVCLGGMEFWLWRIDAKRQDAQVQHLKAIRKELQALNAKKDIELKAQGEE